MHSAHSYFTKLCESLALDEASSLSNLIGSAPSAANLLKFLHTNQLLSHASEYQPVERLSWNDLKDKNTWAIFKGADGYGAIKVIHSDYRAIASPTAKIEPSNAGPQETVNTDYNISTFESGRGGDVLSFLKKYIGKTPQIYFSSTRDTSAKQRKRSNLKPASTGIDNDTLFNKFKPIFLKAVLQAEADVRGVVNNAIKTGNYDFAQKKISKLRRLQAMIDDIESGNLENNDTKSLIKSSIAEAVALTAAHFYPELAGEPSRYYSGTTTRVNQEAIAQLFSDLNNGDTKKLGAILAYFKNGLMR